MPDAAAERLPGRATAAATRTYAEDLDAAPGHHRGAAGLVLPSLGLGSYLGPVDRDANRRYEEAALYALEHGANLLDTAVNYRRQQSERDLGRALRRFGRREAAVVVTKAGFLAPDVGYGGDPDDWVREELVERGVVTMDDIVGGMHCMTPRYLADQLDRSLANLGLETVDALLVHNPEVQLQRGVTRDAFRERLGNALTHLESEVEAGRVAAYGLATWDGFRVPPEAPPHLELAEVLNLARGARTAVAGGSGDDHHLRYVELPLNLAMTEAATAPTQRWDGERVPFLEAAADAGLAVLASATLFQGRLLGRVRNEVREALGAGSDLEAALQFTRSCPGVATALVGMGTPDHARENVALATGRSPDPDAVRALLGD